MQPEPIKELKSPSSVEEESPQPFRRSVLRMVTHTPANYLNELLSEGSNVSDISSLPDDLSLIDVLMPREYTDFEELDKKKTRTIWQEFHRVFLRIALSISVICKYIITWRYFESFVILVIILNVCTIIAEDPNETEQNETLQTFEVVFLYLYTAEALLKIGGLGFVLTEGSYLRDSWNKLDFIIVVTAWVEYLLQEGVNLAVLRTLRLIRPLKSISSIKGLKVLLLALITSFKSVMIFLIVLLFFLLLFAVAGVQMWMGLLRYQCFEVNTGIINEGLVCGNIECPILHECAYVLENPNYGMTSFDNILYAFLVVFQCITAEGWFDVMISVQRAFSQYVFFYFVPLVMIGAFLVLNLILAVIKFAFRKAMDKVEREDYVEEVVIIPTSPDPQVQAVEKDETFVRVHRKTGLLDDTVFEGTAFNIQNISSLAPDRSPGIKTAFNLRKIKVSLARQIFQSNIPCDISTKVLHRVVEGKDLEKVILLVREDQKVISSSITDMKSTEPPHRQMSYKTGERGFEYIVEDNRAPFPQEILRKYRDVGNYFSIFVYLAREFNNKGAYKSLLPLAQELVMDIKETDRESSIIRGAWSGEDIEDGETSLGYMNKISFQTYRIWPTGWFGKWKQSTHIVYCLVESTYFSTAMNLLVIMNTIVLASDHYGISEDMEMVLDSMNNLFTLIFLIEMVLKLIGLGVVGYLRDSLNYLDGTVVIISVIEFFFLSSSSAFTALRTIRIFRSFRVLRVARLFRYMTSMLNIIRAISRSLDRFAYLALLLLLLIIIFALLGMQIFGGKFDFPEGTPRANFDSFLWAFVTIFQVLSTENWQEVAFNGMRSEAGPFSVLFFIGWIFIGNFILLNLFLAILIDSFDENTNNRANSQNVVEMDSPTKGTSLYGTRLISKRKKQEKERLLMLEKMSHDIQSPTFARFEGYDALPDSRSLFIFPKTNRLRFLCYRVTSSTKFDNAILILIFLSSIKLIVDTYIIDEPYDSDLQKTSRDLDIVFTVAFGLEFLLKAISLGFVLSERSYLRDAWNVLDFFIIVILVIEISATDLNVSALKVLRLLRTLRPLRFISQNLTMKIMVVALLESLIALFNVIIVLLIVWLMFAILGVSFFGGKFYRCERPEIEDKDTCELFGLQWKNADAHFDNVPQAMLALFVVSSLEGWPNIMLDAVDSTHTGQAPERNNTEWAAFYFIVFIFIGSFFFLNLFIGVIFETFSEAKRNETSIAAFFLTKDHLLWVEVQELITKSKPGVVISAKPTNKFRALLYTISKNHWFDIFILCCIILNTIQMAIAYEGASEDYQESLEIANLVFTSIFILEALIKIAGLGRNYFKHAWNRFDFFVVSASVLDLVIGYALNSSISILRYGPQLIRVIRVLRVSRLVRIFKVLKGVQQLITVLRYSFTAILNVLSLLFLIMFIYAVMGVFIMHDMKKGNAVDEFTNFDNFGMAMLALLRIATGENWNLIMYDAASQQGWWCVVYFVSFITITSFIMLNLFVMVILQNFDDLKSNPQSALKQFNKDKKMFNLAWNPLATKYQGKCINYKHLVKLMYNLGDELGIPTDKDEEYAIKKLSMMAFHIEPDGRVYYHDALHNVLRRKYTSRMSNPDKNTHWKKILRLEEKKTEAILAKIREIAKDSLNAMKDTVSSTNTNFFITMMFMRVIFKSWKNYTTKKKEGMSTIITPMFSDIEHPGFNSFASCSSLCIENY